jgi:hypothetical protein
MTAKLTLSAEATGEVEIVARDGKTTLRKKVAIEDFQYWIPVITNPSTGAKWVKLDRELNPIVSTLTTTVPGNITAKEGEGFDINRETIEDSFEPIIRITEDDYIYWFSLFHGREIYTVGEKEGYASMADVELVITHETALSARHHNYSPTPIPDPSIVTPASEWSADYYPAFDSVPGEDEGYWGWYTIGWKLLYDGNAIFHLQSTALQSSQLYDIGQKVGWVCIYEISSGGYGTGPGHFPLMNDIVNPYTSDWVYHDSRVAVPKVYLLANGERNYVFDGYASIVRGWKGEARDSAYFCFKDKTNSEIRVDLFEGETFHATKTFTDLTDVVDIDVVYRLPFLFNVGGEDYYGRYDVIRRAK